MPIAHTSHNVGPIRRRRGEAVVCQRRGRDYRVAMIRRPPEAATGRDKPLPASRTRPALRLLRTASLPVLHNLAQLAGCITGLLWQVVHDCLSFTFGIVRCQLTRERRVPADTLLAEASLLRVEVVLFRGGQAGVREGEGGVPAGNDYGFVVCGGRLVIGRVPLCFVQRPSIVTSSVA